MKDKAVGFYLSMIAAVLSLVSLVVYVLVMYKLPIVYGFCAAAVLLAVLAFVTSKHGKESILLHYLPMFNAALMACAAIWGVNLMVNQIGYVIAKLDDVSSILTFIIFEAVAVLSMILNIVSAFMAQTKK